MCWVIVFFLFSSNISIRSVFLDLKGHIDITYKMGKSVGMDNIPAELVQAGGEAMVDIMISTGFGRQENGRLNL